MWDGQLGSFVIADFEVQGIRYPVMWVTDDYRLRTAGDTFGEIWALDPASGSFVSMPLATENITPFINEVKTTAGLELPNDSARHTAVTMSFDDITYKFVAVV